MEIHNVPSCRLVWNKFHGSVDGHHRNYLEISPQNKILRAWKHKIRAAIFSLTENSFINFFHHFNKDSKNYNRGRALNYTTGKSCGAKTYLYCSKCKVRLCEGQVDIKIRFSDP